MCLNKFIKYFQYVYYLVKLFSLSVILSDFLLLLNNSPHYYSKWVVVKLTAVIFNIGDLQSIYDEKHNGVDISYKIHFIF